MKKKIDLDLIMLINVQNQFHTFCHKFWTEMTRIKLNLIVDQNNTLYISIS